MVKENIGRLEAERVLVGADPLPAHDPLRFVFLLANIKAGRDVASETGIIVNRSGDPLGLVRCQGIHGIDEDGLDPGLAPVTQTVIQNG